MGDRPNSPFFVPMHIFGCVQTLQTGPKLFIWLSGRPIFLPQRAKNDEKKICNKNQKRGFKSSQKTSSAVVNPLVNRFNFALLIFYVKPLSQFASRCCPVSTAVQSCPADFRVIPCGGSSGYSHWLHDFGRLMLRSDSLALIPPVLHITCRSRRQVIIVLCSFGYNGFRS